jgi:outer membrane immunogenic protein
MKKILMACAALSVLALPGAGYAADLAVRPAPVVAPAPNWTGCYIGFHAGAGWGDKWWSDRLVQNNVSYSTSGWIGGAQLGCDYQTGPLVVGAEVTWSWTNIEGNGALANLAQWQVQSKIDSVTTAGGRVGLVADKALIYVKVAAAWAEEDHTLFPAPAAALPAQTFGDTRLGYVVGAGIEYMIAPVLTAKIEYNYDDFGSKTYQILNRTDASSTYLDTTNRQRLHLLKLGVNYKFW